MTLVLCRRAYFAILMVLSHSQGESKKFFIGVVALKGRPANKANPSWASGVGTTRSSLLGITYARHNLHKGIKR